MSHSLVKLIDIALLPAAVLVVGKVAGLVFAAAIFQLPWTLDQLPGSLFAVEPILASEDVITASTYSDLIMFMLIAIGFSAILVQATHFHDTHIKPSMLVRLSNNNLLGLVKSSFDIYHAAAVWLLFLWVTSGVVWINIALTRTEVWVGLVVVVASTILTTLLLQDVYKEIDLSRRSLGKQEALS